MEATTSRAVEGPGPVKPPQPDPRKGFQVRMPGTMRRTELSFVEGLRCRECARSYPAEALHVCEFCFGPLEVVYDYEAVAASLSRESIAAGPSTIWRYAALLPADARNPVNLGAGFTPLVRADRLAAELG